MSHGTQCTADGVQTIILNRIDKINTQLQYLCGVKNLLNKRVTASSDFNRWHYAISEIENEKLAGNQTNH